MQNSAKSTLTWLNDHRDVSIDLLRIYLGLGLLLKGVYFFLDQERIFAFMTLNDLPFFPFLIAHYIIIAHICGGILLTLGLLTRIAALIQVPILFGAIMLIHGQQGLFTMEQTLEFTLLVLFLLILFVIYGGGRLSVDALMAKKKN